MNSDASTSDPLNDREGSLNDSLNSVGAANFFYFHYDFDHLRAGESRRAERNEPEE